MKKLIALLLALTMLLGMVACGGSGAKETDPPAAEGTEAPPLTKPKLPLSKHPLTTTSCPVTRPCTSQVSSGARL